MSGLTTGAAGGVEAGGARLEIEPATVQLSGDRAQQIAVTLREADGSSRDVTRECGFRVEPATIAQITTNGLVSPRADGVGSLLVRLGDQQASATLQVQRAGWVPRPAFEPTSCRFFPKPAATPGPATAI